MYQNHIYVLLFTNLLLHLAVCIEMKMKGLGLREEVRGCEILPQSSKFVLNF